MVKRKKKSHSAAAVSLVFLLLVSLACFTFQRYNRPYSLNGSGMLKVIPTAEVELNWPGYGQSAVGAVGFGVLANHGVGQPQPIASIAKVVTALTVMQVKRLLPGEQGPKISITQADVDRYHYYLSNGGSVAPVNAGQELSEFDALQELMLPSANNVADTMAIWAFGSLENYYLEANKFVGSLGMSQTYIDSASGFTPGTVSTASDLVKLGIAALKNPVLAQIVSQPSAAIPIAGNVNNVNFLLGSHNIDGIKTGNTTEAGGCYLFSAKGTIGDQTVHLVGAILGGQSLLTTMQDSPGLIFSSLSGFSLETLVGKGQAVGTYTSPWGDNSQIVTTKGLQSVVWGGQPIASSIKLDKKIYAPANSIVGTASIKVGNSQFSIPLEVAKSINPPSWWWRIAHK